MLVKLTSEAAGAIALSPVLVQEMDLHDLIQEILVITGKHEDRVHAILSRGTLVAAGTRYRWSKMELPPEAVKSILCRFPDAWPARAFLWNECTSLSVRNGLHGVEITRSTGEEKRLLRTGTFWSSAAKILGALPAYYLCYEYRRKADVFEAHLSPGTAAAVQAAAELLPGHGLRRSLRAFAPKTVALFTPRAASGIHPQPPQE